MCILFDFDSTESCVMNTGLFVACLIFADLFEYLLPFFVEIEL